MHLMFTCNNETDSVVADCNDGYTQATGANVCCANITDAHSYDEQCAATCPDGYIVNSDSTACTPIICEENQYVLSFECEPCADGSYNAQLAMMLVKEIQPVIRLCVLVMLIL